MNRNASTRFLFGRAASAAASAAAPPPRLLLDRGEAAAALHISPRTLWTLTQAGQVPHLRIGRQVRYSIAALERWVAERSTAAPAVPAESAVAHEPVDQAVDHDQEVRVAAPGDSP